MDRRTSKDQTRNTRPSRSDSPGSSKPGHEKSRTSTSTQTNRPGEPRQSGTNLPGTGVDEEDGEDQERE